MVSELHRDEELQTERVGEERLLDNYAIAVYIIPTARHIGVASINGKVRRSMKGIRKEAEGGRTGMSDKRDIFLILRSPF